MANKFYAVRRGHKVGIFDSWDECKKSVEGFSGPEYKSFSLLPDAEAYLNNEDLLQINTLKAVEKAISDNQVISYIDGSYDDNSRRYSFGAIIITPKGEKIKESGYGDDPEGILIRNVAGELQGALFAIKWAIKNGYHSVEVRHDYEGIAKWAQGEWKAKNKIAKIYIDEINKLLGKVEINFVKVDAHTNNPLNDEVDKLAKDALVSGNKAKVKKGDTWFTAEGVVYSDLQVILGLICEEIPQISIHESDIPYGKKIELSLGKQEKLVLHQYQARLSIQGKPLTLFSKITTYLSELIDIEKIPEVFNSFFNLEISKDNVDVQFKTYMPNAYEKLPQKIDRVLHQAVYNLNIIGDVYEATFLVEPALRALDGHLKLILKTNGFNLRESPEDKRDTFHMFTLNGHKFVLDQVYQGRLDNRLETYLGKCYTFFNKNRHSLCHWDDPVAPLDTTRMINNTDEAHRLIKNTLEIINEYYTITG